MVMNTYLPMIMPKYMKQFPNSLSLLKGSLSFKSYACHYATSGSKYLIIMFDISMLLKHILVLSNIYEIANEKL